MVDRDLLLLLLLLRKLADLDQYLGQVSRHAREGELVLYERE